MPDSEKNPRLEEVKKEEQQPTLPCVVSLEELGLVVDNLEFNLGFVTAQLSKVNAQIAQCVDVVERLKHRVYADYYAQQKKVENEKR